MIHQRIEYSKIYSEHDLNTMLDAVIVGMLFLLALLNLLRLNHYVPNTMKKDYEVIAQKVMDRNIEQLQLTAASEDIVYENKACDGDELVDTIPDFLQQPSFFDRLF